MRIRKNSSRQLESSDSDGLQQVSNPCEPAWSPPARTAHGATNEGANLTIDKRYKIARASEEICVLSRATTKEDYSENYLEHIACRWKMCNCVAVNNLDEELMMDDMLEKQTSRHKLVIEMEQEVFLEKKMDEDVKMMRMKATEGPNNNKECKKKVAAIVGTRKTTPSSSKSDGVNTLVGSDSAHVSTTSNSASVPTISNPRKRRMVAYGSGQDYYYYTQFGASCMM